MLIIAVDGPAGAGKGTIAGYLTSKFNLAHIDSGRIYRKAGLTAFQAGVTLDHMDDTTIEKIVAIIEKLTLDDLGDETLKSENVGGYASKVAVIPEIRNAANRWMRSFLTNLPPDCEGIVIDGRDIGSAVFPDAVCKLFITASEEVRIQRRFEQTQEDASSITKILKERDERDTNRKTAPLLPAKDAFVLDTSNLTIDEACKNASEYVTKCCLELRQNND